MIFAAFGIETDSSGEENIVFGPYWVTAKDQQNAITKATLANADTLKGVNLSKTKILAHAFT